MKKFIRFIIIFLLVIIVGVLVLALVMPQDVVVTRSILIKAPKEAVFEQIVKFHNWPNWSPFHELDTNAKYTYSATDGAEGSSYSWESKKSDVGAGSMSNTAVKGTRMDYHIDFLKPMQSTASGNLTCKDTAGMTKVSWTFTTHCAFPWNAMLAFPFMDMRKMLTNSFDHGLEKLKRYVEGHPSEMLAEIDIKEVDYPAHVYQGVRQNIPWTEITKFCGDIYGTLSKEIGPRIIGPAAGLYYTWDTMDHRTDMAAVFPVPDTTSSIIGSNFFRVDAAKAYMTVHKGGYHGFSRLHMALTAQMAKAGKQQTLVIEEYVTGPAQEPDSNKWVTNIYYLMK